MDLFNETVHLKKITTYYGYIECNRIYRINFIANYKAPPGLYNLAGP